MRVRWLKLLRCLSLQQHQGGRTPCECVDWNVICRNFLKQFQCRTPCECVDWNKDGSALINETFLSHSMRVRWLKCWTHYELVVRKEVALHASALIEMFISSWNALRSSVALHASALIEMSESMCREYDMESHSMRVRWLKYTVLDTYMALTSRTPCECVDWNSPMFTLICSSLVALHASALIEMLFYCDQCVRVFVALHASALIEITGMARENAGTPSRTPCECVDWNMRTQ